MYSACRKVVYHIIGKKDSSPVLQFINIHTFVPLIFFQCPFGQHPLHIQFHHKLPFTLPLHTLCVVSQQKVNKVLAPLCIPNIFLSFRSIIFFFRIKKAFNVILISLHVGFMGYFIATWIIKQNYYVVHTGECISVRISVV